MGQTGAVIPLEKIEQRVLTVRAQKVMLDSDLADLYGVTTKRLNEQVRRNRGRFPADFMFRLTEEEAAGLRSQNATSKGGRGGRRYPPSVFTEHGAIMPASVLSTTRAVDVSVYVVRAFVRLREMMATNREVAAKLGELEQNVASHDAAIRSLVQAIRQLTDLPPQHRGGRLGSASRTRGRAIACAGPHAGADRGEAATGCRCCSEDGSGG